jgi:hypothetical protein
MKITYVGPFDAVELDTPSITVKRDETIDVPVSVAGRAPDARVAEIAAELAESYFDHAKRSALLAELVDLDHGAGLLAQTSNWTPAAPAKKEPK